MQGSYAAMEIILRICVHMFAGFFAFAVRVDQEA